MIFPTVNEKKLQESCKISVKAPLLSKLTLNISQK
ncbi:hypothetical protein SVI_0987 [Shewanella violacea DSS12]|uniref:Uncharacterized protein n=1 Tax=Shewanella violacea (strain JCM 10179 / CIP 106290 / LMG 19151 / DSS12) TaxID=637905 RepID=D4ZH09_SHEVD|nr:hypothetical protein SVI_0987 [Shewanella violacea DSS12]